MRLAIVNSGDIAPYTYDELRTKGRRARVRGDYCYLILPLLNCLTKVRNSSSDLSASVRPARGAVFLISSSVRFASLRLLRRQ